MRYNSERREIARTYGGRLMIEKEDIKIARKIEKKHNNYNDRNIKLTKEPQSESVKKRRMFFFIHYRIK